MKATKALRTALRAKFGTRQYLITKDGMVHVYGTMPNTNQEGWYLLGSVDEARVQNVVEVYAEHHA